MLIYRSFYREETPMGEITNLTQVANRLIKTAYPELNPNQVRIEWGRTSSFATVSWTQEFNEIRIKCSNETKRWPEPAIIGLLSHELSHPAQMKNTQSERSTDLDVVERGLGPFLGVERLFTGKYEDHVIKKGMDRYLGYRSIRQLLSETEMMHLDALLEDLRLAPSGKMEMQRVFHDMLVIHSSTSTMIRVDGQEFSLPLMKNNPHITIIHKGNSNHLIVDGEDVGSFSP
jgi:hypothetical protein